MGSPRGSIDGCTRGTVPMISAWGATETSPVVTSVHFTIPRAGVIGLPAPGCTLKMVPSGQQLELRVKGPNVTPGYWRDDTQTREAFDDEGFYCIGDAGRFADIDDPSKGVVFDGRVAEDFKLTTGTWVHTSALRVALISAGTPSSKMPSSPATTAMRWVRSFFPTSPRVRPSRVRATTHYPISF